MASTFKYCPQISVDGGALNGAPARKKFEDDTIAVLTAVYDSTWSATAVIDAVATAGKAKKANVVIMPVSARGALATAGPDKDADAAPADAVRYGGARDNPATRADERYGTVKGKGTGLGSSSHITFDPNDTDPDKTIVHELLHSLREMLAQFNQVPTVEVLRDYENQEE